MAVAHNTTVAPPRRRSPVMPQLSKRERLEAAIARAIEALDALDGDIDLEAEEDSCAAHDDDPHWHSGSATGWGAGDEDDAEDGGDDEMDFDNEPSSGSSWMTEYDALFPLRRWNEHAGERAERRKLLKRAIALRS